MLLLVWLSCIDDCACLIIHDKEYNSRNKKMKIFDCDDVVNMDDYVWCNINGDNGFTFTHLVMLQGFRNKFDLPKRVPTTPAITGKKMTKDMEEDV